MEIVHSYRNDPVLRHSFNALARETFGLDFEPFYRSGYWGDAYNPCSVVEDGAVVANVSVNEICGLLHGRRRRYIQLGTVMTANACRGRGLSRMLMETVLRDFAGCDGFFLFANDTVLGFYPKFGFQPAQERRFFTEVRQDGACRAESVPMNTPKDWSRFLKEKNRRESCGVFQLDADGLLMFYLTGFMRENVYYLRPLDAYAIAGLDRGCLTLYDVFSPEPVAMERVVRCFGAAVNRAVFAFTPQDQTGLTAYAHKQEDTSFFLRGNPLLEDMGSILSFPDLAHA